MKYWNQVWTPDKWQRAQDMRANGVDVGRIAAALKLTLKQVQHKFNNEHISQAAAAERVRAAAVLDRRDSRSRAEAQRSLTGAICGDPPPGCSALDKKRAEFAP